MSAGVTIFRTALAVLAAAWLSPGAVAEEASRSLKLKTLSPDGADACFGRVYDKAHLGAHPAQKVSRIFFLYGRDPVTRPNEEPPNADGSFDGFLTTTTRSAKKPEWVSGWCGAPEDDASKVHCGMECDRSMASFRLDEKGRLHVTGLSRDVYLGAGAEEDLGKAEFEKQSLGEDDNNFMLERVPVAQCKAEFGRIDPIDPALGAPLRERLKPDEPFCFGRDYDQKHLASHPDQVTATIRVFRGPTEIASADAGAKPEAWPGGAQVTVSVTTRAKSETASQSYSCVGEGDAWACAATAKPGAAGGCDLGERTMYLRRGANGAVMLANPNTAVPIADLCGTQGPTGSDDKVYRLAPMPRSACGF